VLVKSKKENEIWTFLKMSNFENPKYFSKKLIFSRCDQNAVNFIFDFEKTVMIIFCKKWQNKILSTFIDV